MRDGGLAAAGACERAHGHLRVGEAALPGPAGNSDVAWKAGINKSPMAYPVPGKIGFHGCYSAGFDDSATAPPKDLLRLRMETVNATGWRPLAKHLRTTEAHIMFAQEHRLLADEVADASAWARRHGWRSVWTAAIHGPSGGASAGTAVFARDFCGLRHPDVGGAVIVEGRATSAVIEPPSCRPFMGIAAYYRDGEGLSKGNLELSARIGDHICAQGPTRPLFAIGADFNMEPEVLGRARLSERLDGRILAPTHGRRTCRTRTAAKVYDYFYMATPLAELISKVTTVEGTGIRTHVTVAAEFLPRPAALRALGIRQPPKLPTERLYGPLPGPSPRWAEARKAAEKVAARARDGCDEEVTMKMLDDACAV